MKFPLFASFIIFILVLKHNIDRGSKIKRNTREAFWNRENNANNTRKQPLDSLSYISFSCEKFSPKVLPGDAFYPQFTEENPRIQEIQDRFVYLAGQKIVNLNYLTNTELKLTYGVANLPVLTEYDQNYSELITLLQEYATLLYTAGFAKEALPVLEYAISIGSDISASYQMCATLYKEQGTPDKINWLIQQAEKLQSFRKNAIVRMLQECDPYNG